MKTSNFYLAAAAVLFLVSCQKEYNPAGITTGIDSQATFISESGGIVVTISPDNPAANSPIFAGSPGRAIAVEFTNNSGKVESLDGFILAFHGAVDKIPCARVINDSLRQLGFKGRVDDSCFIYSTEIGENVLAIGQTKKFYIHVDVADDAVGTVSVDLVSYLLLNSEGDHPDPITVNFQGNMLEIQTTPAVFLTDDHKRDPKTVKTGQQHILKNDSLWIEGIGKKLNAVK